MQQEKGVVLIAVLWICALVMWFTLQIGAMTRMQGEEQVHLFRRAQAHYLAIGGCYEALARMGQPPPSGSGERARSELAARRCRASAEVSDRGSLVSIESEMTKVNVNSRQS